MSSFPPFFDSADMTGCFSASSNIRAINELIAPHGLYFPLWADCSKSLAFHLQSGSFMPASHRFGTLTDNILGLNLALKNGTLVRTGGRGIKNCTGFDLTHFILNSQHQFGQVTDVILRLRALPGPLRWFACQTTPEVIEQFRRRLSQSPWWHLIESVDVILAPPSSTLLIGMRGSVEVAHLCQQWLSSTIETSRPFEISIAPEITLPFDVLAKTLPSQAIAQASDLVARFGGVARLHLTCGFFRWNSPLAVTAQPILADLRSQCVKHGGHLFSPHLHPESPKDETRWVNHLEKEWQEIAA